MGIFLCVELLVEDSGVGRLAVGAVALAAVPVAVVVALLGEGCDALVGAVEALPGLP